MPIRVFQAGEVLTASNVNSFLQNQVIARFATTTARDDAFGGAGEPTLAEGLWAYTDDTNTLWFYSGTEWVEFVKRINDDDQMVIGLQVFS